MLITSILIELAARVSLSKMRSPLLDVTLVQGARKAGLAERRQAKGAVKSPFLCSFPCLFLSRAKSLRTLICVPEVCCLLSACAHDEPLQ